MKQVRFFGMMAMLLCAVVMGFSSCDEKEDLITISQLVGVWETDSFEGWSKENGKIVDEWQLPNGDYDPEIHAWRILFHTQGWWNEAAFDEQSSKWIWEEEDIDRRYVVKGDKILTDDGPLTVLELSATKLVVEYHDKYENEEEYEKITLHKVIDADDAE